MTMIWLMRGACVLLVNTALIVAGAMPAAADGSIIGRAEPIDGDTFAIGDLVIRLADIDAPELAQICEKAPKHLRRCGEHVAGIIAHRIRGQTVHCDVQEVDQYDRRIARCEHDGEDLSVWLIVEGWAMAYRRYSMRLVDLEDRARAEKVGLWAASFEAPWDYRAKRWEVAIQEAPDGCPIKGNISRDGKQIYHTPWGSRWYSRTKVSVDDGERWFCTEGEAIAAGWRAPRR